MTTPRNEPPLPRVARRLPMHIEGWQLPPAWKWGEDGLYGDYRHYQEVIDGLGRSLAMVTAPNPAHAAWLFAEARQLAQRSHPSIPTTYHYWMAQGDGRRGPGYLRRWVTGETVSARLQRLGVADIPFVLQVLRGSCSTLAYLHNTGLAHGGLRADALFMTPTGRLWMLEWQWAVEPGAIPVGARPGASGARPNNSDGQRSPSSPRPRPPEWGDSWNPSPASDQWQIGAICFSALTGEMPPAGDIPPVKLVRPECPDVLAKAVDRALSRNPEDRFPSLGALMRAIDRGDSLRTGLLLRGEAPEPSAIESDEARLRWAVGDDYEILSQLGRGGFGTVWRARDLSLEREVALKALHPQIARDDDAVRAFWREARLAAQLAHPAIVPIYDLDSRGEVAWYTMELAEEGSIANLIARSGPRTLSEIAPQVDAVLDALAAAHARGILHRDLKPENILIDRYRRWRLTDFGIANITGEDVTGGTGTPAFSAPEQLLGEAQGPQADCFSLAAIVIYALTGSTPFGSDDATAILGRQLGRQADLRGYPPVVVEWLRRALEPEPERRFADAAEMRAEWRAAMNAVRGRRGSGWWRRALLPGRKEGDQRSSH
ncbi:MAG: serine/threonine-protein kinase [Gemmatimonadota bacterium]|nr:serine/threonine-protein kinase [Gemmatimonadota bacterium]